MVKKAAAKQEKKEEEVTKVEPEAGKKTKTKRKSGSVNYAGSFKKVCKSRNLRTVSKATLPIVTDLVHDFIQKISEEARDSLGNKMFTSAGLNTVWVSFAQSRGVSPSMIQGGLDKMKEVADLLSTAKTQEEPTPASE
jgi:hypothetical protein